MTEDIIGLMRRKLDTTGCGMLLLSNEADKEAFCWVSNSNVLFCFRLKPYEDIEDCLDIQ
ncbi:hypothetical protein NQZ68_029108 [Dissostichus eleginoides]|nr:hypothetical protein NQZ68_029108 [Dissostichus eleginoides]